MSLFEASSILVGVRTGAPKQSRDEPGGSPFYWPGGAGRRSGVNSVCWTCTEHEKASTDMVAGSTGLSVPPVGRGRVSRQSPKALSTDAVFADGPARGSCETAAFWGGGGAKGPAHQLTLFSINQCCWTGRKRGNMAGSQGKAFDISKRSVWEAYRKVAGNRGAPGVDKVTLEEFETDLQRQLVQDLRAVPRLGGSRGFCRPAFLPTNSGPPQ